MPSWRRIKQIIAIGPFRCLIEAGIIDPTKVVRVALENAVPVASVLLLSEAAMTGIAEAKKESGEPAASACSYGFSFE
jgi:chaperonin GroEL (HSP60 family)